MGRKHCRKRRNCSLRAISPFPTVFSKGLFPRASNGLRSSNCFSVLGNGSWIKPPSTGTLYFKHRLHPKASKQNVWLFNITADPYERNDLSRTRHDIVHLMLNKLKAYSETAVPVRYPKDDPKADPKYLGGFWGPWVD